MAALRPWGLPLLLAVATLWQRAPAAAPAQERPAAAPHATASRPPACSSAEACQDDPGEALVGLLQTNLAFGVPGAAGPAAAARAPAAPPPQAAAVPVGAAACLKGPREELTPLGLRVQLETLYSLGYLSRTFMCDGVHKSSLSILNATSIGIAATSALTVGSSALVVDAAAAPRLHGVPVVFLLIGAYLVVAFGFIFRVLWTVVKPYKPSEDPKPRRPEEQAWKTGFISWFTISWATPWVSRYGNTSNFTTTKVKHQDLGLSGFATDEAANALEAFKKVWYEDLRVRGEQRCNMYWVIFKFCTARKVAALSCVSFVYEILMYLAPTFAVNWTLEYMSHLQELALVDPGAASIENQTWPVLVVICLFTGMPLLMAICNTIAGMVSLRMNIRLQAALGAFVYQKASRLPLGNSRLNLESKEEQERSESGDNGSYHRQGRDYSLVQLINTDISNNLMSLQSNISRCIIMLPIIITLIILLAWKMGTASFYAFLATVNVVFVLIFSVRCQVIRYTWYQAVAGGRLTFLQEVLFSIRMAKANGWEGICLQIVNHLRDLEMEQLGWYYAWFGFTALFFVAFPKVVVLCGLAGYFHVHGSPRAADVFVMMQLLTAFKSCTFSLMNLIPELVAFGPSLVRIDRMLKMEEAPLPGDKAAAAKHHWLTLWPKVPAALDQPQALRIQGDFLWCSNHQPALRDLDIQVKRGELVAVMGEVGAGKSTLLQAMLGELEPTEDSRLEIPHRVAYHAQVPVICEATLKDNVLFWSGYDEERYKKAIYGARLLPDLEVLPGGDLVPIGSRGISLSGGQKARVSLARAAYALDADVVLCDDPFASVDQPTGKHIMEHLLMGPLMEDRARVVVCQPDRYRTQLFDRVIILGEGRVLLQGPPQEVMATEIFQALLSSYEAAHFEPPAEERRGVSREVARERESPGPIEVKRGNGAMPIALRDEEYEGRADLAMVDYYLSTGKYRNVLLGISLFVCQAVLFFLFDLVLARWANSISHDALLGRVNTAGAKFLKSQVFWGLLGAGVFFLHWCYGSFWQLNVSRIVHSTIMQKLMYTPVDRFYDKTPVGRIMNRLSFDITEVDTNTFVKLTMMMGHIAIYIVPIIYVHCVMPLYLLAGSLPFYYLLYMLIRRYWCTMVPVRYLNSVTRSDVNAYITDVEHTSISSRAYQVSDVVSMTQMSCLDGMQKAQYANFCIQRWVCNRILVMYSLFCTCVASLGILTSKSSMTGTLGLCLSSICEVMMQAETFLTAMTEAQYQFISMNRLHEYTDLPQENPPYLPNDGLYDSPVVNVQRQALGGLEVRREGCRLQIVRRQAVDVPGSGVQGAEGEVEVVMEQIEGAEAFQPVEGKTVAVLDPTCPGLLSAASWHRLHAVNGIARDAAGMAQELCHGTSHTVWLNVRSGWLFGGARVVISDLVAGYADMPTNVLKGVTVTFEAKSKTAIAGTTGCGKSTLMLNIMRMIEPRGGKIEINGVNTQSIGITTLRKAMGMVPQDPVLFSGTLRNNLDNWNVYTDEEMWAALRAVQMANMVFRMQGGLDAVIKADGGNLSFGQKQLLSIARQILRNPELLLLDECTSAIDPHTQELVQDAIRSGFPDATVVAIAHRLETIMDFDSVVVLDKGRVVEKGGVQELAAAKGSYFARMLAAKGGH